METSIPCDSARVDREYDEEVDDAIRGLHPRAALTQEVHQRDGDAHIDGDRAGERHTDEVLGHRVGHLAGIRAAGTHKNRGDKVLLPKLGQADTIG